MIFAIEICKDRSTRLIARNGDVLWCFPTLESARDSCIDWYALPEIASDFPSVRQLPDVTRASNFRPSPLTGNKERLVETAA